jgi:hypothetical protein
MRNVVLLQRVRENFVVNFPGSQIQAQQASINFNAKQITGPIFYAETINSDRHVRLILTEFFTQLTEEERSYACFSQYSVTAHTTDNSLMDLEGMLVTK